LGLIGCRPPSYHHSFGRPHLAAAAESRIDLGRSVVVVVAAAAAAAVFDVGHGLALTSVA